MVLRKLYGNGGPVKPATTPTQVQKDVVGYYNSYLNSPNYRKRLVGMGYPNPGATIKNRLARVNSAKLEVTPGDGNLSEYQFDSNQKLNKVIYDPNITKLGYTMPGTISHEYGHSIGGLGREDPLNPADTDMNLNEYREFANRNKLGIDIENHDARPWENVADLQSLRYRLKKDKVYDTGTQTFTPEHLRKAKSLYSGDNDMKAMFQNFSDEDIIYLMNHIASNGTQQTNKAAFGGNIGPGPKQTKPGLFRTNRVGYVDSVLNANKNLDWVQRLHEKNAPTFQVPGEPELSTHFMSDDGNGYVFPSVVRENGKMRYLGDYAEDYARQTNTGIQFPKTEGTWFADNGYKIGTGVNNSINSKGIPYNNPRYKIQKGYGGFIKPFAEEDPQKKFLRDYINSPNYRARLAGQGYKNINQVIKDRQANLAKTSIVNQNADESTYENRHIKYSPSQSKEFGYTKPSVLAHEFSHSTGSLDAGKESNPNLELSNQESNQIRLRNRLSKVNPNALPIRDYMNYLHDSMPQETKGDLDALRYNLKTDNIYDTGTQKFDINHLKKAKEKYKNDGIINRLFKNYSDDDLIYLMNNIAATNPGMIKPFA